MNNNKIIYPAQMDTQSFGQLSVHVTLDTGLVPIPDALVSIAREDDPANIVAEVRTDVSGQTEPIDLQTPPEEYSLEPENPMPYSEYTITAQKPNFDNVEIHGAQILPNVTAIQPMELAPSPESDPYADHTFNIEPHTLYGDFPPKIAEDEIKPLEDTISNCIDVLKSKGRLCVITFHSLEDRAVKNAFNKAKGICTCPKDLPYCVCGAVERGKVINKKPIIASEEEQNENSRSKSAKLRIFEKI